MLVAPSDASEDVLAVLRASRTRLLHADPPAVPGVYALFLATPSPLFPGHDLDLPIYIGRSVDLRRRAMSQHLKPRASGSSTLRRSLGAVLKSALSLTATPRGSAKSARDYTNYRFDDAGESVLTEWMDEHLLIAFHGEPRQKELERLLVIALQPPLNIEHCGGPAVTALKSLRALCADEARSHTRDA